jgi:replicative DNA helicase
MTSRDSRAAAAAILGALGAEDQLRALHQPAAWPTEAAWADRATPSGAGVRWDGPPTPLSARRLLPPFPLDVFPTWAQDMASAVTTFLQTPPDLAGCLVLAALSTAAGGRAVVEVRPGWREPVNLFVVVALPPGERKSPAFKALTAPLLAAERALIEAYAPRVEEAELALRVAKARAERTAKTAENAVSNEAGAEAMAEALDAAAGMRDLIVPAMPQLVADDVTPEAAASLLAEQGGRLAVLSDEGGILAPLAGRYSRTPNLDVFLKGHAATMLRVNRTGRGREHVESPALTLGLAVQPDLLKDIAAMQGFRGRGLLARILFSLPASTVGRRTPGTPAPTTAVTEAYSTNLQALVLTLNDWTDPAVMPLTPDASMAVLDLEGRLEPQLAPGAGLAHVTDWAGKLTGATARIAGLLHLATNLRDGWGQPISVATLHDATRLATYFLTHALAVFDLMGADPQVEDARHLLDWITRRREPQFSRRDAHAPNRSRFPKPADLDPALALLTDHGWIQPLETEPRTGRGRPASPRYAVHPDALNGSPGPCTEITEVTQSRIP